MSEMVERVARALKTVPGVHGRTNKMRSDGLIYEIGYVPEGKQDFLVLRAMPSVDGYGDAVNELQSQLQAKAAIAAMREPTEAMIEGGWNCLEVDWRDMRQHDLRHLFRAMIDEALK